MAPHALFALTHPPPVKICQGAPILRSLECKVGFGDPKGEEVLGQGPVELGLTHRHECTLVLRLSTVAAQETKNKEHNASCDEKVAHVDKLHGTG